MIKGTAEYKAGPVKTLTRSQAKVENDYINENWPKSAKILDINRCAIEFSNPPEMMKYIKLFTEKVEKDKAGCIKQIIRCKNGWSFYNEEYPQYTDIKLNCLVHDGSTGIKVISEIQFLLTLMSSFKKKAHKLYAVERKFELVYNFGVLTEKMNSFKENNDLTAVFKELIEKDDVKFFKNLCNVISLPTYKFAKVLPSSFGIINSETGKIHNYLNKNFKKVYRESILCYCNSHKVGADWNYFLNVTIASNATDEKDKNNMKLRFVNRLFEVFDDKIQNKHNFTDLEEATKTLKSIHYFKCLLEKTKSKMT